MGRDGLDEIMSLTDEEKLELLHMWDEFVTHNMDLASSG